MNVMVEILNRERVGRPLWSWWWGLQICGWLNLRQWWRRMAWNQGYIIGPFINELVLVLSLKQNNTMTVHCWMDFDMNTWIFSSTLFQYYCNLHVWYFSNLFIEERILCENYLWFNNLLSLTSSFCSPSPLIRPLLVFLHNDNNISKRKETHI